MTWPAARAADGYVRLGQSLLVEWRTYLQDVGARPAPMTANQAVKDAVEGALLAARGAFLLGSETLDAIAILKGPDEQIVTTRPYVSPPADAELELVDDFVNLHGRPLPLGAITIERLTPEKGETRFRLRIQASGHPSGAYRGTVRVTKDGDVYPAINPRFQIG